MASKGRKGSGRASNGAALKAYWTTGAGSRRIRWGTSGDWGRCNRELSKYLGSRAKGYCQLRHMAALGGMTTSAHAKALRGGRKR